MFLRDPACQSTLAAFSPIIHQWSTSTLKFASERHALVKDEETVEPYLPEDYEYLVCSFVMNGSNFKTRLRTTSGKQEHAQKWLEDFQMHPKCTMRVERTYPHSGTKNVFKIDLRCQHNTRPRSDKVREKESYKNTDCPAKMGITVKRVMTERKSRSKDPHLPDHPTVLQLDFCHNHPISTPEILRHRSVLPEVKGKILSLFKLGHNPSTALDMHKYDLQLEHGENYIHVSQDRAMLPDPQFCYRLYYKILRRQATNTNGDSIDCNISDGELDTKPKCKEANDVEKYQDCNSIDDCTLNDLKNMSCKKVKKKRKLESALIDKDKITSQLEGMLVKFCDAGGFAGMQLINEDTVMAFCSPLMHRVHTLVSQSSELVFVDTYGEFEEPYSCKVLLFLAHSCGGALPLGCLVTTSMSSMCIKGALNLWKQILPEGSFYGKTEGPQVFLTSEDSAERESLKHAFPSSHQLVCISHLLQSSWCFLWDRKSAIKKEHRSTLFSKVKMLLFSQSADELEMNYAYCMQDVIVKLYSTFMDHYSGIYNQRHEWCLAYRHHILPRSKDMSIYWEASMVVLKDPILSRARTYNPLQVIDFLSRLDTYYEKRLIDIANSRYENVKNSRFLFIEMPQEAYTITQKSESEYEVHNDAKDTTYHLDISLGMCECRSGRYGAPCKHQLLVFRNFAVPSYDYVPLNTQAEKALVLQLATGQKVENGMLPEVSNNFQQIIINDSCSSDLNMADLTQCSESDYFLSNGTVSCDIVSQTAIMNHEPILNSHSVSMNHQDHQGISQHNHVMEQQQQQHNQPQQQHHLVLNHHIQGHESEMMNHHTQNLDHHTAILTHSSMQQQSVPQAVQPPQMNQHGPSMGQSCTAMSEPHHPMQSQPIQQPSPPPPPPPPMKVDSNHLSQVPEKTVHALIEQVCKKMKQRTSHAPQTFTPALDTFLKNLDKLSSDSSLEYALYSFGKFSKSAMPLFRRKIHNNKLVGLQSAGDMKKKTPQNKSLKASKNCL